ncbi:MAG: AraC family transcriptional regulator, partial [Bacteroidota bacterium]
NQFAQPYAYIAVCYYYLEVFKKEKEFTNELNTYADRAMLLNPQLPESLIAKALFYMNDGQYELAVEFFEKVLEYNPDSGWAYNFLSDIYTTYLPDTEKYLIHAAKGIDLVVRGQDSTTAAVSYLHLSNALAQNGFIAEAEKYVNISLGYMPNNVYAETVQTYVELAKNMDLQKAKNALHNTYQKDTTNLLVLQEIAKIYYFMQDYELGWKYYEQLFNKTKNLGWDIYASEKINAAYALEQLKQPDLAKKYLQDYLNFAQADPSIYQPLLLSTYYAYVDDIDQAIVELEAFSEADKYMYWLILFLDQDPVFMKMADHPQFDPLIKKINDKFWKNHEQLKIQLKEETVI